MKKMFLMMVSLCVFGCSESKRKPTDDDSEIAKITPSKSIAENVIAENVNLCGVQLSSSCWDSILSTENPIVCADQEQVLELIELHCF